MGSNGSDRPVVGQPPEMAAPIIAFLPALLRERSSVSWVLHDSAGLGRGGPQLSKRAPVRGSQSAVSHESPPR
jgi:hypothetical protein